MPIHCFSCEKSGIECDYSVRLNWLGDGNYRPTKKRPYEAEASPPAPSTVLSTLSPPKDWKNELESPRRFHDTEPLPAPRAAINTEPRLVGDIIPTITAPPSLVSTPINEPHPISSSGSAASHGVLNVLHASLQADTSDSRSEHVPPTTKRGGIETTGAGAILSYDEADAIDTPPSPQPSRKKSRYSLKPANLEGAAEVPPWSPSSASTTGSPGLRPCLPSTFSLPSAPSPLTSVSTPDGEEEHRRLPRATPYLPWPSDIRRLSVQSLLTSPHDHSRLSERPFSQLGRRSHHGLPRAITPETATFYGYDNGQPDEDIGQNDDAKAIMGYSPIDSQGGPECASEDTTRESLASDFGFGMRETGNYYERRIEVRISKELEPLPPKLRQNPMNILYFHHFLNHTARVLVPHDDPQSNPFRTVLPQMAVKHDNLLSLLLAYSASHRARHLKYPEPSLRIAHLVQGVIADLRSLVQQSMNNPGTVISTADLAAAIMLASLEIISPAAIGGSIPWHHHLNLARELISRMPDGLRSIQASTQEHCVRSLLWSWFAYLDVLGSLSGGPSTLLTPSCYTSGGPLSPTIQQVDFDPAEDPWDEDMERIDCILGFTPRCVFILARIAELARHCEEARLHSISWTPDPAAQAAAAALETAALRSLAAPSRPCGHVHAPSPLRRWDRTQMAAANRAFHHAALIHLHRRVLGKKSSHPDVRGAAQSVLECLEHVERGSSAETCLLFPMFTAGCELVDPAERGVVLERIVSVERTGMMQVSRYSSPPSPASVAGSAVCGEMQWRFAMLKNVCQVHRARKLMEKVWETGRPWETLVDAEFIG